jgi:hypothetical protein
LSLPRPVTCGLKFSWDAGQGRKLQLPVNQRSEGETTDALQCTVLLSCDV